MIIKGTEDMIAHYDKIRNDNLDNWYNKNKWAPRPRKRMSKFDYEERDFIDYDYAGRGLSFEFFEIPN